MQWNTRAGFSLVEALLGLVAGAIAMVLVAFSITLLPDDPRDAQQVWLYQGHSYPKAPDYGQLRAASDFFEAFNAYLHNCHAAFVHSGAVSVDWTPFPRTNLLSGLPDARYPLSSDAFFSQCGPPLSNFSVADLAPESFMMTIIPDEAAPPVIVHCHLRKAEDSVFYWVRMFDLATSRDAPVQEYSFYMPANEANWGKEPSVYPSLSIGTGDPFRRQDGPITVVFPDPFLLTGSSASASTVPYLSLIHI